ncbi:hypothetical protein BGW41_007263 [Actinomortierella wolfii]|nr:hypothetical protein BGW41_007263 [Actinomortierella wolfii]
MSSLERLSFFEDAVRLESLTLEGNFEIIPILQVLIRANSDISANRHGRRPGLSRLKRLTLRSTSTVQESISIDFLFQALYRLNECAIETRACMTDDEKQSSKQPTSNGTVTFVNKLLNLRSLDLNIRSLTRDGLAQFLGQCPKLEHLRVIDYDNTYVSEGFGDLLQQTCPALRSLVLVAHGHQVQGQELVQALMRFPRLSHLGIESMRWGDQSLVSLQQHCPAIESLDIGMSSGWKIRSETLQRFLVSATGLKHLKVRGLRLAVEDMVDPETGLLNVGWGCTKLETLSIGFSHAGGRLGATSRSSHGQQQSQQQQSPASSQIIHNQLAKLTKLQTLELLVPIVPSRLRIVPGRRPAKIEQAERDLELLGTLQQLRQLRIMGTGHGSLLTERQIKWMVQAWPKLESIVVPTGDHMRRSQFEAWMKQGIDSTLNTSGKIPTIACQCCE